MGEQGGGITRRVRPVRVAWVVSPLPARGGTLTHLRVWATAAEAFDIDPILVYHSPDEDLGHHLELPGSLPRIRLRDLGYSAATWPKAVAQLVAGLKKSSVDIIHTMFIKSDLVGVMAGTFLGIPVVSSVEGELLVPHMRRVQRFLAGQAYRRLSRRFARILAVSRATASRVEALAGVGPERIAVVFPGIPVSDTAPKRSRQRRGRRVVAAGRLVPAKRFDRLISAVAIARAHLPDLTLTIVGDGPLRASLARRIDAHRLGDAARITGWLAPGDVTAWYDRADLVALSSSHEGLPWSALEAMARGVPVLAPRVGGLPELIRDDEEDTRTGFLVDSGRVLDLVSGLLRAFQGSDAPERLETLGRRARDRVRAEFSSGREMAAIRATYEQALSGRLG